MGFKGVYIARTCFPDVMIFSGSDGLIKLWTIKSNECVKTLDDHEDKIWAVTVSKTEEKFISGGADSTLIEWKVTLEWLLV